MDGSQLSCYHLFQLIIYDMQVADTGDWYGYVTPTNLKQILAHSERRHFTSGVRLDERLLSIMFTAVRSTNPTGVVALVCPRRTASNMLLPRSVNNA